MDVAQQEPKLLLFDLLSWAELENIARQMSQKPRSMSWQNGIDRKDASSLLQLDGGIHDAIGNTVRELTFGLPGNAFSKEQVVFLLSKLGKKLQRLDIIIEYFEPLWAINCTGLHRLKFHFSSRVSSLPPNDAFFFTSRGPMLEVLDFKKAEITEDDVLILADCCTSLRRLMLSSLSLASSLSSLWESLAPSWSHLHLDFGGNDLDFRSCHLQSNHLDLQTVNDCFKSCAFPDLGKRCTRLHTIQLGRYVKLC